MDLQAEYNNVGGPGDKDKAKPIDNNKKLAWNAFIDYLDKNGYKGSTDLDNRDKNLGQTLLAKFNAANPKMQLSYDDVPLVQSELQNYRQTLINKWKAGQAGADGIKSADDIMPGLSPVDGWLGSKTSSYRFPVATITHTDGTKQDFGVNTDQYDNLIQGMTKTK